MKSLLDVNRKIADAYRDEEEERILQFLEEQQPDLLPNYLFSIPMGRQGILNRLVSSMLREDVFGVYSKSYDLHMVDSIFALNVPEINEFWRQIIRTLHRFGLKGGPAYKVIPLGRECVLAIPVSRTYAFRRIEVQGAVFQVDSSQVRQVEHPVEFLQLLRGFHESAEGAQTNAAWNRLADELRNGCANLALAYAYGKKKKEWFQSQAVEHGWQSTLEYVFDEKRRNPEFDAQLFFEQLCMEGHNLHPGAKTKMGMQPEDVYAFAPEFGHPVYIRFVGIQSRYAEWAAAENVHDANDVLFHAFPALHEGIEQEFAEKGLKISDYVIVPVHPWQWAHAIPEIYREELARGIVVPIDGFTIPFLATSSFRTLCPVGNGNQPAVKVAVNSQMTSTVRSISANTTHNAPEFTRLIKEIMDEERQLSETFIPVYEWAGYNFKMEPMEHDSEICTLKSRNLSVVLRQNINALLEPEEVAIVGSALYAQSPISGKPVLVELVESYAKTLGEPSLRRAAFHFVSEYAGISLPGYLTLMVKYGIGLEGHLQNSVPVFRNSRPVRMLFRDWGGARIYSVRLEEKGHRVRFYPGSVTVSNDLKEMQNKVFYTVFQNHFGEIILQASKAFGVDERELWREVRRICDQVFDSLECDPAHREAVRMDREALYQPEVDHKSLTKMRLDAGDHGYHYTKVPNPLHDQSN